MTVDEDWAWREMQMRNRFDSELPIRLRRATRVQLQHFIPAHWFAAAASECAGMYVAGFFYGAISVAQAYIEAMSRYIAGHHNIKISKDTRKRCRRLNTEGIISDAALAAALAILDDRNDFHHLNKDVEQDYQKLESRTEECINHIHTIESEVFAYTFGDNAVLVKQPTYWPSNAPGLAAVHIRQLW
jgi:hypothetical protein